MLQVSLVLTEYLMDTGMDIRQTRNFFISNIFHVILIEKIIKYIN